MADGEDREQERESRPATGAHPIARVLRSTYDADNHDSLGNDLTGLMLELARVEDAAPAPALPTPPARPGSLAAAPPSWLQRLLGWVRA